MSLFADTFSPVVGYVAAACCALTVFCTAMIYASLRTIPQWHTWLVPATYMLFSLTSGTILYLAFFGYGPGTASNRVWVWLALVFLIVAWAVKLVWAQRAARIGYGKSDMASATGLGHLGRIRLLEKPHAMDNYLTREMAFRIARKHVDILRVVTIVDRFRPAVPVAVRHPVRPVGGAAMARFRHVDGRPVRRTLAVLRHRQARCGSVLRRRGNAGTGVVA